MFSAFTPLAGGSMATYDYPSESPFNFDAGLDFTRPQRTVSNAPTPPTIGWIDGFLPLMDTVEYAMMVGAVPSGPYMGVSADFVAIFPNMTGALAKTTG